MVRSQNSTRDDRTPGLPPERKRLSGTVRVVSCGVFRPAIDYLELEKKYPRIRFEYLSPNLHLLPHKLRECLVKQISGPQQCAARTICLYGECCPDIDDVCRRHGASRVIGANCYEILLGSGRFTGIIDETAGTYFLERQLLENFQSMCAGPLELFDEEVRRELFKHYKRVIYVRQPADPDLAEHAREIADFLKLSLEVWDSDYSHLERRLEELIERDPSRGSVT
jgi:hypothetical protein